MFTASLALPPPQIHFPFLPALPFLLFPTRNVAGRQVERLRKALRWDVAPVLTDFNPGASRHLPCCLPCCCPCCLPNFRPPQAAASSTNDACRCRSQAASHLAVILAFLTLKSPPQTSLPTLPLLPSPCPSCHAKQPSMPRLQCGLSACLTHSTAATSSSHLASHTQPRERERSGRCVCLPGSDPQGAERR